MNKVAGGNGSVSSRASSDGGSQRSPRAASFETKVGENKESASPPSGKKHRKRKHEAYEALATTMTSLAKEVSSLAVNQQWMMQHLTGRPAAPGEHSAGASSSHWPAPRGATDDCEGISLIASDNLEDDYIGNRAATSPHPSDLSSDQSSSSHSVPSDASAALSDDEFIGLMCRAARRIKVEMPATTQAPPSRFDRTRDATSTPSSLPVLPDLSGK